MKSEEKITAHRSLEGVGGRVKTLAFATTRRAPLYRAIMGEFFAAKQRYVIELRADEVRQALERRIGESIELPEAEGFERALAQLVRWNNLGRSHDTSSVSRVEDFYRRRHVYHLTAAGEAAFRAVLEVEAAIGRSGSLQTSMLRRVRDALEALAAESGRSNPDVDELHGTIHDLFTAFDTLTREAPQFMGELDREIRDDETREDHFQLHKQAVLSYVSRFVAQLRRLAEEIRGAVVALRSGDIEAVLRRAAGAADRPPGPIESWVDVQLDRFRGLCAWFVGEGVGGEPTVDRLAAVAVGAVVDLTRMLSRLNDQRSRAVDRAADFRVLARWFTACPDDAEAHSLWQAAFGLSGARHFHLAEEDAELTSPDTSWWDAEPVTIPLTLRQRGTISRGGRPPAAPDHSSAKEWIAQLRRREREREEAALTRFEGRGPQHLAELDQLDDAELELLMTLLDESLGSPDAANGARRSTTADGRLTVTLIPASEDDTSMVSIETPLGRLRCRDHRMEVTRAERSDRKSDHDEAA